jgi:hypothetical protein
MLNILFAEDSFEDAELVSIELPKGNYFLRIQLDENNVLSKQIILK